MDINTIRKRVQAGNYLVQIHAVQHALKEGFERKHMVEAILTGKIIEQYPNDQRVLICGSINIFDNLNMYLHVVCQYADLVYIEFITAYIPDEFRWQHPPFKRRRRKRK